MPDSILLYRPDHIGDYLLTTPLIRTLKESFPEMRLVLAAGNWSRPLIQGNPNIDELLPINLPWMERYGRRDWRRAADEVGVIRSYNFPVIFNLRKALKESMVSLLFGSGERWGFDVPKSAWLNRRRVAYNPGMHIVENYLGLAKAFGASGEHRGLEIFLTAEERSAPIAAYNIERPYIIIAPGAGHRPKMWPAERWHLLVKWLIEESGRNIVITGAASDEYLGNAIAAGQPGPVRNLAGKISLRQLAALIAGAEFMVCVDSAAMHIGAAMDTPLAALFGYTDPAHWGPYPPGERRIVARAADMEGLELAMVRRAVESLAAVL